jgi:hypothetical protein
MSLGLTPDMARRAMSEGMARRLGRCPALLDL